MEETNEQLVARYQAGDEAAFVRLLEQCKGMIYATTKKYSFALDDAKQEASIALMLAAQKYSSEMNVKFSSYCSAAISNRLISWNDNSNSVIRINTGARRNGASLNVVSADSQMSPEDCDAWSWLTDESCGLPSDAIEEREERLKISDMVSKRLSRLSPRDQKIVRARLGEERTLEDIANEHGTSKGHVHGILEKAMEKLSDDDTKCRNCGSTHFVKWGIHRNGKQRFKCGSCGKTTVESIVRSKPITRLDEDVIATFFSQLAQPNATIRGACRAAGIHKNHGQRLVKYYGVSRKCRTCNGPITGNRFWFCSDDCQQWRQKSVGVAS